MNRKHSFVTGEYYHLFGRGHGKGNIFRNDIDKLRFLFSLMIYQSTSTIDNLHRQFKKFGTSRNFLSELESILSSNRLVELVCFTLMTNHYHIILKALVDDGISKFMQRVLTAYTMYFNTKYERIDNLFGGPFKSVHIITNDQFLYTSAYVHRNSIELGVNFEDYEWSSFKDYLRDNRWGKFLATNNIYEQFNSHGEYVKYVRENPSKDKEFFLDPLFEVKPRILSNLLQ